MTRRLVGWTAVVTGIALLLGVLAVGDAAAWDRGRGGFHHGFHGHRGFFGPRVFVGPRFYGPGFYPYYGYPDPYPYYDYPPPVVVTSPPTRVRPEGARCRLLVLLPGSGRLLSDAGGVPGRLAPGRAPVRV